MLLRTWPVTSGLVVLGSSIIAPQPDYGGELNESYRAYSVSRLAPRVVQKSRHSGQSDITSPSVQDDKTALKLSTRRYASNATS
jgi:hypothetical protein